jgi:pimeloyl-ACP methyl ester carboxylesterase
VVAAVRARYLLARPYLAAREQLDAPSAIVCGRDDHWAGFADALTLVRLLRHPRFCVLPDCGHLLPIEQPAAFQSLLADWVARALSSPPAP